MQGHTLYRKAKIFCIVYVFWLMSKSRISIVYTWEDDNKDVNQCKAGDRGQFMKCKL